MSICRISQMGLLLLGTGLASNVFVTGCSSTGGVRQQPVSEPENSGTLGLALQLTGGVTLNTVSYAITGNGVNKTGSIDVRNSTTISATIGGIPAGAGYTITLSASDA